MRILGTLTITKFPGSWSFLMLPHILVALRAFLKFTRTRKGNRPGVEKGWLARIVRYLMATAMRTPLDCSRQET